MGLKKFLDRSIFGDIFEGETETTDAADYHQG